MSKETKVSTDSYDKRYGGPYDRGECDSYYQRGVHPHFYREQTYELVEEDGMTPEEREAYLQGYRDNEAAGNFKRW